MVITENTSIEELVTELPESVTYLMKHHIKCIACGDPIWGTLGEAARQKGFHKKDIEQFVNDLNQLTSISHY
jgi:hypothetical protein